MRVSPEIRTDSIAHRFHDTGVKIAALLVEAGVDLETPFLSGDEIRLLREGSVTHAAYDGPERRRGSGPYDGPDRRRTRQIRTM